MTVIALGRPRLHQLQARVVGNEKLYNLKKNIHILLLHDSVLNTKNTYIENDSNDVLKKLKQ